jgi:hypothetical protein
MVSLSPKQTDAWWALESPSVMEVFFGGGAGSGKSWMGCVWQIMRRTKHPCTRGFIGRETLRALEDSTMKTYFDTLERMGLKAGEAWTYNAQSHNLVFKNGSEQHFRHMSYMPSDPDYNRFGSTEYTDAFVDEAPEVAARACQVLLSRLRYRHTADCTPALLYTGNPGESWVKDQFVMDGNGNFIGLPKHRRRILGTVADNPDAAMREQYTRTLEYLDPYDRARLLYGDWTARPKVDNPFAFAFERTRHVGKAQRFKDREVYFGIDFNVEPFTATASHIWTDQHGPHFHTFAEVALKNASIKGMAEWITSHCSMQSLVRITGDRNGTSRAIGANGPVRLFEELRKEMKLSPQHFKLPPNPPHLQSREDYNFVLSAHPDRVIDTTCTRLIGDLQSVEWDGKNILKADRSKASQQADALDCDRYVVNTFMRPWLEQNRRR